MPNLLPPLSLPDRWVSIDPGDLHVGMAKWEGHKCTGVIELSPRQALHVVKRKLEEDQIDALVYEKFALDPRRAGQQSGSEFKTSQMIGVLKWFCEEEFNTHIEGYFNHQHKKIYRMGWYTALTLKDKRRLPWWGSGSGKHCMDAWCVGMWFKHMRGHGQYGLDQQAGCRGCAVQDA